MSLALLFHYLVLNMFWMLVHPSSGACDLFVELFHGLYCSGKMCVGDTVWFGWGGVVSGCRLKHIVNMFLQYKTEINIVTHHGDKGVSANNNKFSLYKFMSLAIYLQCLKLVCFSSLAFELCDKYKIYFAEMFTLRPTQK